MFNPIMNIAFALAFVSGLALVAVPSNASPINSTLLARANSGDGTFYAPGMGACGITNSATDLIAAMAYATFDSYPGATANPNTNPICNKKVIANYQGKSVTVTITDRCAGCAGEFDLDFSPAAFDRLADESVGRIHGMTWDYA
ncbi:barwin-like endoglucanase [Lentinula aciculospora]|uniref:Barwin-like endoglucanase n=1 Tax=Lentinula aciculospora TaxID=153920 RepID=A0A9W9DTN7_9AGAR|nr:barwin-like endoglucanase [Lentinula aciculospora]